MDKTISAGMVKRLSGRTADRFDAGVIPRLLVYLLLSEAVSTPLRIFAEIMAGKTEAPSFITTGFLIYAVCAELVVGIGYMILGYRLPVRNTVLRGFAYIMLICVSSYLPNILAMAGGDGEIIAGSLTAGIVVVDILTYVIKGLILGYVMRKYHVPHEEASHISDRAFLVSCIINGAAFAALNIVTDMLVGAVSRSWRLCAVLGVSAERETAFYIVFTVFMFIAGLLMPLWYRYCMTDRTARDAVVFSLELSAVVWLPNVLIMAFFGTPAPATIVYSAAYVLMFVICIMIYRKIRICSI